MRSCNIDDNTRTTACETVGSILESGVSNAATDRVVKGPRWLGYVAVNMGAAALAQADHPSLLELRLLFSKNMRVGSTE